MPLKEECITFAKRKGHVTPCRATQETLGLARREKGGENTVQSVYCVFQKESKIGQGNDVMLCI